MKLRVKTNIQLPYVVTKGSAEYVFKPDAVVPDDYGKSLLRTYPHVYEEAKGEADLTKYTFKKEFKNQTIVQLIGQLSEDEQVTVAEFVSKLIEKRGTPAAPSEKGKYDSLTVAELEEEIEKRIGNGAVIKPASGKKADLIAALEEDDLK
jgi:putative lipoic acid-binding regulatory protein